MVLTLSVRSVAYLLLFWPIFALAGPFSELLQQDLVNERDDTFTIEHTLECHFEDIPPISINRYLEAPSTLISRDVAVFLKAKLLFAHQPHLALLWGPGADPLQVASTIPWRLAKPVSEPDIKISAVMHSNGIRVETLDGKTGRSAVDELDWGRVLVDR